MVAIAFVATAVRQTQAVEILLHPTADLRFAVQPLDGSALSVYNNGTDNVQRTLLKFDLSSILAGSTITSAQLNLTRGSSLWGGGPGNQNDGEHTDVYRIMETWNPASVGWTNPWTSNPGGNYVGTTGLRDVSPYASNNSIVEGPGIVPMSWDVRSLVSEWVLGPSNNHGLILTGSVGNELHFYTNQAPNDSYRPSLVVNYVPEPSTFVLLGVGALAIAGCHARRLRRRAARNG
jgi:hypothetical protein